MTGSQETPKTQPSLQFPPAKVQPRLQHQLWCTQLTRTCAHECGNCVPLHRDSQGPHSESGTALGDRVVGKTHAVPAPKGFSVC